MRCVRCGEELESNAKFCSLCGESTQGAQSQQNPYGQPQDAYSQQQYPYGRPQEPYYQQQYPYGQPPYQPISGTVYIVISVLVLIFCCVPLGIPAIIYSSKIDGQQAAGDYIGAQKSASNARILLILGVILGVIGNFIVIMSYFI